jgi:hypothetical protein
MMLISAALLLILKLSDLEMINLLNSLEITFYVFIIILMTYNFIKLNKKEDT